MLHRINGDFTACPGFLEVQVLQALLHVAISQATNSAYSAHYEPLPQEDDYQTLHYELHQNSSVCI